MNSDLAGLEGLRTTARKILGENPGVIRNEGVNIHQENCKFAFSAFPSRKSGKKWKKQGNYSIVKQDPRRSSAKSMKSSASFPDVRRASALR